MIDILHVVIPLSEQCAAFGVDLVAMSRQNHPGALCLDNLACATQHRHLATFDIDLEKSGRRRGSGVHEFVDTRDFDVFVTVDRNLTFQQNLTDLKIAVIVLVARGNRLVDLQPLVPGLLDAIEGIERGQVVRVDG